jgi:two-component system, NtrC family, response regulator AtoC
MMTRISTSILAVDDEESILHPLSSVLEAEGYYVNTAADGRIAINMLQTLPYDVVLLDIMMPNIGGIEVLEYIKEQQLDSEVIMLTAVQEVKTAVECMKLGAYYYLTKPYLGSDVLGLVGRAVERKRLLFNNKALKTQLQGRALSSSIITQNKSFLELLDLASRAAPSDSTILIEGSSGTGKELVANFIHNNSERKEQPMLALNCSSIPEALLESELFGHERGAFTDATSSKQGLVEMASGGTLFLDEVAELPLTMQPKLLRFLQTGEFRRVGGNKNMRADVRVISATNADLRNETSSKRFREDLLFRLNVITLRLPPLRERKDDIPLLIDHFLKVRAGTKQPQRLDENALEILMKYDWPGNVRELENVLERACVLSQGDVICLDDLALPLRSGSVGESVLGGSLTGVRTGSAISLLDIQKSHVEGVLASVNWEKELAAKILGIRLNTLYNKIRSYHLKEPK